MLEHTLEWLLTDITVFHRQLQHNHALCSSLTPTNPASVTPCNNFWLSCHNFRSVYTDYGKNSFIQKQIQFSEISFTLWGFAQVITVHTKSCNRCTGTKSQYRPANPLKLLSAWDPSSWFLRGICIKLMACLNVHTMGLHLTGSALPGCRAGLQFLLSTAPVLWRGDAPWVLQHSTARVYCALALMLLCKGTLHDS